MNIWPDTNGKFVDRYLGQLRLRYSISPIYIGRPYAASRRSLFGSNANPRRLRGKLWKPG